MLVYIHAHFHKHAHTCIHTQVPGSTYLVSPSVCPFKERGERGEREREKEKEADTSRLGLSILLPTSSLITPSRFVYMSTCDKVDMSVFLCAYVNTHNTHTHAHINAHLTGTQVDQSLRTQIHVHLCMHTSFLFKSNECACIRCASLGANPISLSSPSPPPTPSPPLCQRTSLSHCSRFSNVSFRVTSYTKITP